MGKGNQHALYHRAEQGDADAQVSLGNCYMNGTGVEKMNKKQLSGIKKQLNKVISMHKIILVCVISMELE